MARAKFPTSGVGRPVKQPGAVVREKNDGTLEGSVVYHCDESLVGALPRLYSAHPDDQRLMLYEKSVEHMRNGLAKFTGSYFGLAVDPTPKQISFPAGTGRDPIETHPDFADFGGTPASPLNGAQFDPETGEFLGFVDPSAPEWFGVRSYIVPNVLVYISWWTFQSPRLTKLMSVRQSLPDVVEPPGVDNWLLVGMPYRTVGKAYQVTEQWMGSGPEGWNRTIYP